MTTTKTKPRLTSLAPQFLVDDLARAIAYYQKLGFTFGEPWDGFYAIGQLDGLELHLKEAPNNADERRHRRANEHLDAAAGVDGIEAFYAQCVSEWRNDHQAAYGDSVGHEGLLRRGPRWQYRLLRGAPRRRLSGALSRSLFMNRPFTPSFQNFQKDIEHYLKSEGKCEKNEHGQTVYRGYPAALALMFRTYMDEEAFAPLVAEFRKWNWEWNYGDHLLELTLALQQARDWPLLKELWAAVVAKRRTNYNKTKKAQKALPEKIPEELVTRTRELLLDSLYRLQRYASELGHESDVEPYLEMIVRVEKRLKA